MQRLDSLSFVTETVTCNCNCNLYTGASVRVPRPRVLVSSKKQEDKGVSDERMRLLLTLNTLRCGLLRRFQSSGASGWLTRARFLCRRMRKKGGGSRPLSSLEWLADTRQVFMPAHARKGGQAGRPLNSFETAI